jgi:hypothetical protein
LERVTNIHLDVTGGDEFHFTNLRVSVIYGGESEERIETMVEIQRAFILKDSKRDVFVLLLCCIKLSLISFPHPAAPISARLFTLLPKTPNITSNKQQQQTQWSILGLCLYKYTYII